jgi:hypothetical protein
MLSEERRADLRVRLCALRTALVGRLLGSGGAAMRDARRHAGRPSRAEEGLEK